MSTTSYKLLKISYQLFDKHWNDLNTKQRQKVFDTYYDFY